MLIYNRRMLLRLLPYTLFEAARTERLRILEDRLRRNSHGRMALGDYVAWLDEAGTKKPASRRTLHEDLRRYGEFCDDVVYGENSKSLELDSRATRDATAWLMGRAWVESPLKPYLPSAVIRCLLLAMEEKTEVHFHYRKLRNPGEPWQANPYWCVPLRLLPGADGGYMEMFSRNGGRFPISLSRVSAIMGMTDQGLQDYPPLPPRQYARLTLRTRDTQLQDRLSTQFKGLVKQDQETLVLELEEGLARMTWDMLEAHLARTKTTKRSLPHEKQYENATIIYEPL